MEAIARTHVRTQALARTPNYNARDTYLPYLLSRLPHPQILYTIPSLSEYL